MLHQPYVKELSLNYSCDEIWSHIIEITDKIEVYTLVSESKTLNRCVIKETGINIEINLQKVSDNVTNLKILTLSDGGKYFSAETTVMQLISNFEDAICASLEGRLDEYKPKNTSLDFDGCISIIALIAAIGLVILGVLSFFSI
jgi:hypothetical protein